MLFLPEIIDTKYWQRWWMTTDTQVMTHSVSVTWYTTRANIQHQHTVHVRINLPEMLVFHDTEKQTKKNPKVNHKWRIIKWNAGVKLQLLRNWPSILWGKSEGKTFRSSSKGDRPDRLARKRDGKPKINESNATPHTHTHTTHTYLQVIVQCKHTII